MAAVGTPSFSRAARMACSRTCISATAASTSPGPDFDCAAMYRVWGARNTSACPVPRKDAVSVTVIVGGSGTGAGWRAGDGAAGGEARATSENGRTSASASGSARSGMRRAVTTIASFQGDQIVQLATVPRVTFRLAVGGSKCHARPTR
jgi:hypothetical protein